MKLRIQQCITQNKEFVPTTNNEHNVGVEIQNFAFPQVLDGDWAGECELYEEKLVDFHGIISLHGPFMDLNPATPDKKVLAVTRERYLQCIHIAQKLNASYVIFHSQINPDLSPEVRAIKVRNQLPFWNELLAEVNGTDLTILLENQFEEDYRDLLLLVEQIQSPKVKICLDLGHVLAHSPLPASDWLLGLKPYLEYSHLHWNNRTFDAHLCPPADYLQELATIFQENDLNPIVTLEYNVIDLAAEVLRIRGILEK